MRVLVVEDELIISENICYALEEHDYTIVGQATDYEGAVKLFTEDKPDLVLLDISIASKKNGIDVARFINTNNRVPFIFTSALSDKETIRQAKETKPAAYLIKPFKDEQLVAAIEIAMANFSEQLDKTEESEKLAVFNDSIFIKDGHKFVKIGIAEILYIQKADNYLDIYANNERYTIRSTLGGFLDQLKNPSFFRTHKSYAINLEFLSDIRPTEILIKDIRIPLSKNYAEELKSKLRIF